MLYNTVRRAATMAPMAIAATMPRITSNYRHSLTQQPVAKISNSLSSASRAPERPFRLQNPPSLFSRLSTRIGNELPGDIVTAATGGSMATNIFNTYTSLRNGENAVQATDRQFQDPTNNGT